MIRRISKNNDLRDIIKSCPSGVIEDIYSIKYYIQGYNAYIDASFEQFGSQLIVTLPAADLATLPNGILMRKAYYKVVDEEYPDGYYNLEFEDNMNIWLGENDSETPIVPEYVTESELSSTLSSYATQSWVSGQNYLTSVPSEFATKAWVSEKGYITTSALSGYATESWVSSQGYLKSVPSEYATQNWVLSKGYITTSALSGYATESWVQSQGYLTSHQDLSSYATKSWVSNQGYLTSVPSEFATKVWVSEQGYITTSALSGYATESWVQSQGYLTSHQDLSSYATISWAESTFFEESKIWTGTLSDWVVLTAEQQALYTIALITE
jgi:hypothetical protein